MPKGKRGRFSEVHMEQFKKMDSIAGHPSSFRAGSNKTHNSTTGAQLSESKQKAQPEVISPSKSLRRKHSNAEVDEQAQTQRAPFLATH